MLTILFLSLFLSLSSYAQDCTDFNHKSINMNNEQVLVWKANTVNGYLNRGYVKGVITNIYRNNGHSHFAIDIDRVKGGDIEIIYNDRFGALPELVVGNNVVACGDYITANKGSSLPSPMGAIVHWVHYNPGDRDGGKHPHGFVIINGKLYGDPR